MHLKLNWNFKHEDWPDSMFTKVNKKKQIFKSIKWQTLLGF